MGLNTYDELAIDTTPELVFGLVGPIGVDIALVQRRLESALESVRYNPVEIRITKIMQTIETDVSIVDDNGPLDYYKSRMDYANEVRKKCDDNAALAALALMEIKNFRSQADRKKPLPVDERTAQITDCPVSATAYVIRQFKTKEEIALLRAVYGKKFIQISVHASEDSRKKHIINSINIKNPELTPEKVETIASQLIDRDRDEGDVVNGQRLGKIFHLGDVFVDAKTDKTVTETVNRFVNAMFGKNSISPTKDEYGSYIAASASLRSIDPSRQVGAAIFSKQGEVITLGSNEVPKFGGGTYWEDDDEPHRDFDDNRMPNHVQKSRMLYDVIKKLDGSGLLGDADAIKSALKIKTDETKGNLLHEIAKSDIFDQSLINDITEFGRMTHAEMNAITDAARLGRPTKNTTLFSTTFPCHNCAKHIVAAGITRVVFIEPYPKSLALDLNGDSITLNSGEKNKVIFDNFVGISPRRYRDIFEKSKRRDNSGNFKEWFEGVPAPRVLDRGAGYVLNENSAILETLEKVTDEINPPVEI